MARSASKAIKAERKAALRARKERKLLEEQIRKSNEKCEEAKGYLEHSGKNIDSNLSKAKEILDTAIELYNSNSLAFFLMGEVYLARKQYQDAVDSYSQALSITPTYVASLERRAICFERLNDINRAIQDYTSIIELDSNNDYAYNMRGLCILNSQVSGIRLPTSCFKMCENDFNSALRINKCNYYALANLGKLYEDQGALDEALVHYTAALSIKENYSYARFRRGCTFLCKADNISNELKGEEKGISKDHNIEQLLKKSITISLQKSSPVQAQVDIESLKQEIVALRHTKDVKNVFRSLVESAAKDFSMLINPDIDKNLADPIVVLNLGTCAFLLNDLKHAQRCFKHVEEIISSRSSFVQEGIANPICDLVLLEQALELKKRSLQMEKK